MIKHILKKDLKRKKTMNIILTLFVVIATLFIASSVNNLITVVNGIDYYFEKANLGDYLVITMGEGVTGKIETVLSNEDSVKDYRIENTIFAAQDKITKDGKVMICKNTVIIQSLENAKLNFFDQNNNKVTKVESGKVYTTSSFMETNGLHVGDKINIKHGDVEIDLEVQGKLKDAFLGSNFMGNTRMLLSEEDFQKFNNDPELNKYYAGEICYIDTDNVDRLAEALGEVNGMAFNKPASMIRSCYLIDMVVAGVLMVLSVCLIIIAFVVMKFTINFTLEEEFREIGVMKAIGIKNKKIRQLYLIKYLFFAILGAIIGLGASIPFGKMLLDSVSENMVLGNDNALLVNILSAILVIIIFVAYAYRCTGKIKTYSPIDAIRNGQTGERFRKKSVYPIKKSRKKMSGYLAMNDILSSPKRYRTIILAFSICSLLVLMVVNTTETMKSDKLAYTFGKVCDAYYTDVNAAMESMKGEGQEAVNELLDNYDKKLADASIPAKTSVEVQYILKVEFNGKVNKIACQQGIRTLSTDYVYYKGTAPMNAHEIAITDKVAEITGAAIGDMVKITYGEKTEEYLVTAYFRSMNQLGEVIRLHQDTQLNMKDSSSVFSFQFDFTDNPSQAEINKRVETMKKLFNSKDIFNTKEYVAECIGVIGTLKMVEKLLLLITLIIVVLVTVMMERSFILDEKSQIATLKAIGFSNKSIISWHSKRFFTVGLISVLMAVLLSIPATKLCITPIFGMMGLKSVDYNFVLYKIFLVFPGIILAVTVLATVITANYIRTVKCTDTSSIE